MLAAFIMAGGAGERFWPLSTKGKPKQLLRLVDEKRTLIRMTVDRISPIIPLDRIFIGTNKIQEKLLKDELPEIPSKNIIIEPIFKDTAAAIGYGSIEIERRLGKDTTIVVLASDHIIKNEDNFRKRILGGSKIAKRYNSIVTLGIKPNKPETGYGYIETREAYIGEPSDVIRFWEKPNFERAEEYVEAGNYLWNSGMFIFQIQTIIDSFKIYMPKHWEILDKIRGENSNITELFKKFEKISIDFGIMEKSQNIKVIPVDFGWNDVGSFPALDEVLPHNKNGTISKVKKLIEIGSKNNIILGTKKVVATIGIKNLVIVETEDSLLICKKERAQDIKKVLKKLNL